MYALKKLSFLSLFFFGFSVCQVNKHQRYCVYAEQELVQDDKVGGIFFVPDERAKDIFLGLIHNEKEKINLAMYYLTDKEIIDGLIVAKDRGVDISVVVDALCTKPNYEKVSLLIASDIDVHVFAKKSGIMHHKFCIFYNNFGDRSLVSCGSVNATQRGFSRNEESMMVFDNEVYIKKFEKKFFALQKVYARKKRVVKKKNVKGLRRFIQNLIKKLPFKKR